jgi:hypothetical protein
MTCSRSVFFVLRQIERIVAIARLNRNLPAVTLEIKGREIGMWANSIIAPERRRPLKWPQDRSSSNRCQPRVWNC